MDKLLSSSNKKHQRRRSRSTNTCKLPCNIKISKCLLNESNKWRAKSKPCKPAHKITLSDLCNDRIKRIENETNENSTGTETETAECEQNISFGDQTNTETCVCPQKRCCMPKSKTEFECNDVDSPCYNLTGPRVIKYEEEEENCEGADYDDGECTELDYCDECEEDDEDENEDEDDADDDDEDVEQKNNVEFNDLLDGCFSVDRNKLEHIYDKYAYYEEYIPLDLHNENIIYGDQKFDCYCLSHEGTPWMEVKQKLDKYLAKLMDYNAIYGDITCVNDNDVNTYTPQPALESGLLQDWCLCSNAHKCVCPLSDRKAGGDTSLQKCARTPDLCHGTTFKTETKCRKNANRRFSRRTPAYTPPAHTDMSHFVYMQRQNQNCNHPYVKENEFDVKGKSGKKEKTFYDEEIDELFIIDSPSQPGNIYKEDISDDDIYFGSNKNETDNKLLKCSSNSNFYADEHESGHELMINSTTTGQSAFLATGQEAIVDRVTEGITQILNLVDDIPKPGGFAYRGPLGHRDDELKVTLMSYQNQDINDYVDDDELHALDVNKMCNSEEIEFDTDTESNEEEADDETESEESDDESGDDDEKDKDENDECFGSSIDELRKGVNECILAKESSLIATNTSATVCSSRSQESSDSCSLEENDADSQYDNDERDIQMDDSDIGGDQTLVKSGSRDAISTVKNKIEEGKGMFKSWMESIPNVILNPKETTNELDGTSAYTLIKQYNSPDRTHNMKNIGSDRNEDQTKTNRPKSPPCQNEMRNDSHMIQQPCNNQVGERKLLPEHMKESAERCSEAVLQSESTDAEKKTSNVGMISFKPPTKEDTSPYRSGSTKANTDNDPGDGSAREGMFSFKPPTIPDESPNKSSTTNSVNDSRPSYVLSPKARKIIMENRYGKMQYPINSSKARSRSNSNPKRPLLKRNGNGITAPPPTKTKLAAPNEKEVTHAVGDHVDNVRFNPPLTKREIEIAESASKPPVKGLNKTRSHIQELKFQNKNLIRNRIRKVKYNPEDANRSNANEKALEGLDDESDSESNSLMEKNIVPKGLQDGRDITDAVSKKVLLPKGYTMRKKTPEPVEDTEELNQRRQQQREQRREMMANLSSKAKDKIKVKPVNVTSDRPMSPINHAAAQLAARAKDEFLLQKPTNPQIKVVRQSNNPREHSRRASKIRSQDMREPAVHQSNDRYSWVTDRRQRDFYKKYGGDYQGSIDSPFSQLFDDKSMKTDMGYKARKSKFANERYRLKKIEQEYDPYDIKRAVRNNFYPDDIEDDGNSIPINRTAALKMNQLTLNAKNIAQQRNQRWKPMTIKSQPGAIKSPTQVKCIKTDSRIEEIITHPPENMEEPPEIDPRFKMMTYKIKSKQDMAQIMPVSGNGNPCAGDEAAVNVQAVNMYKPEAEEPEIKSPTVVPSLPSEGPGLLSRMNPLRLFFRRPHVNGDMGKFIEPGDRSRVHVNQQTHVKTNPCSQSGEGVEETKVFKDQKVRHHGSSVDVIAAPCGLASEEYKESWKSESERLKQQRKEKLRGLFDSKRQKEDINVCRDYDGKRFNKSNNSPHGETTENKPKTTHKVKMSAIGSSNAPRRDGLQRKKETPAVFNANNNCSSNKNHSGPKIDFFAEENANNNNTDSCELKDRLERSVDDGAAIQSTLQLLIEWYVICISVLVFLFMAYLCPNLFQKVKACPVPSFCTVVNKVASAPLDAVVAAASLVCLSGKASVVKSTPKIKTERVKKESSSSYPSIWSSAKNEFMLPIRNAVSIFSLAFIAVNVLTHRLGKLEFSGPRMFDPAEYEDFLADIKDADIIARWSILCRVTK